MADHNRNRRGGQRRPNRNRSQNDNTQRQNRRESGDVIWEPRRSREQPPPPKQGWLQRFLSIITFGLVGGKKKPAAPPPTRVTDRTSAARAGGDRPGPRSDGSRPRREDRQREERREPREERRESREPRSERPRQERPPRERSAAGERPLDPPNPDAITGERLHIGNLNYDTTEGDLFDLFNGVGKVKNVEVVTNRHTQRSKGFGFVQMQTIGEAKRAVEVLHGQEFMGRKLIIGPAKSPGERQPGDQRDPSSEEEESEPEATDTSERASV